MRQRSPRRRRRTASTSSWSSTGWTPSRRSASAATSSGHVQNQHRAYRFDVTDLVRAGETELVVDFAAQLTATEQASVDAAAPGAHQRPPVQRDPQDGLQLRVGLGPGPRDRRHLAGGAGRALAHGPAGRGTDPRDGRRRGRPGRGARRRGSRHRCHVDDPRRLRGTWRRGRGGRRRRRPSSSTSPTRPCGGRAATANSPSRTCGSSCWPTAGSSTVATSASGSAAWISTPRPTPTARRSRCASTGDRCS